MNSFSLDPFDFGEALQEVNSRLQSSVVEGLNKGKQNQLFPSEDWGDISFLCSEYSFYEDDTFLKLVQLPGEPQHPFSDSGLLNDFHFNVFSPPIESSSESAKQDSHLSEKEKPSPISSASLKLLRKYRSDLNKRRSREKRLNREESDDKWSETTSSTNIGRQRLSTEEILRLATSWYTQFPTEKAGDLSTSSHPLGNVISGLDDEDSKDVELFCFLFVSAEKVGNQHFYEANKVLNECNHRLARTSNPVERVVYYFAKALRERINQEIWKTPPNGVGEGEKQNEDLEETMMSINSVLLTYHQELPFTQVQQFVAIQAIIDNVASEKNIHLIDLGFRTGMQWTILIQALTSRHENPLEFLKITAVGKATQRANMEETSKRLLDFADTMKINFSFMITIVSDIQELEDDLLVFEADEAVAVYSPLVLRTMLGCPDHLETLMRAITKLNPCVMVVTEIEANHNSSCFFNRFTEALFFYSTLFDCLEASTTENNRDRMNTLEAFLGEALQNIVAREGKERTTRGVGIDVWRMFFARFGMVETELSQACLHQASLILKKFNSGSYFTLAMNGECLTVGWKGTPLHSVSAWKFH